MRQNGRREFLMGGLAVAGCALIPASAGTTGGRPPTRRFLDAVIAGDLDAVRERLGEDPGLLHVRDRRGRSVFTIALLYRHEEIAAFFRESGYRPDLHESALALDWDRFEELAAATPGAINQDHAVGGTAMYAAAIGGAGGQIWRVYRFGGEPNVAPRGTGEQTAIRAALEFPDLATAELTVASMLGNGADPNLGQAGGSSVLHAAASRGSLQLVEMLIRKGADVEALDARGRTALESAREAGHREVEQMLRRHREIPRDHSTSRAVYDVEGKPYRAPDLSAFSVVERGRVVGAAHTDFDAVRAAVRRHPLLAHSVATTTESAVEASAHMGRVEMVDFLLQHGAPCSLPTAVMRNDLTRARALLEEDPLRINERGPHDFALLWYPVIGKGLIEMAELLLEHGAQVERQHWLGTTALHYAAVRGQTEMAELLIEKGADVNRVGRKFGGTGVTPLQIAESRGHEALAGLLRARGATG